MMLWRALTAFTLAALAPSAWACSNPDAVGGDMIYNTNFNVMQYCNGTNWINMGGVSLPAGWNVSGTSVVYSSPSVNVGIGTDSPRWDLHIQDGNASIIVDSPQRDSLIYLSHHHIANLGVLQSANSSNTVARNLLIQPYGGNVGLGIITPTTRLDVNGTVNATAFTVGGQPMIPTGAIWAFDLTTCPSGWSEYTPARGRFLRGIDNGAGNDPSGTRVPGSIQEDLFRSHRHQTASVDAYSSGLAAMAYSGNSDRAGASGSRWTDDVGGPETRPKNVAVLFCRKD